MTKEVSAFANNHVLAFGSYPPLESFHILILCLLTFTEHSLEKKHSYHLEAVALGNDGKIVGELMLLGAVSLHLNLGATMGAYSPFGFLSLPLMPTLQTGVLTFGVALGDMGHILYRLSVLVSAEWWEQIDAPCHCLL